MAAPVYTISLPVYTLEQEPDHKAIGKLVDDELRKHFLGQTVLVRGLGSQEHSGKSAKELIDTIQQTGTDRYDSERVGDRYDNVEGKRIDLFALQRKVTHQAKIFWQLSWSFYNFPPKARGPIRVDILTIYDPQKLKAVVHQYEGQQRKKRDGYKFKDPAHAEQAVLGIIRIK